MPCIAKLLRRHVHLIFKVKSSVISDLLQSQNLRKQSQQDVGSWVIVTMQMYQYTFSYDLIKKERNVKTDKRIYSTF